MFMEIVINDKKYVGIPANIFEKYKDLIEKDVEKQIDIEDYISTKEAMKNGEYFTSAEVDALLDSKNPIEDFIAFKKLDIDKVAQEVGFTKDYILRVARGQKGGSTCFFKAMAKALDVDISYLIN